MSAAKDWDESKLWPEFKAAGMLTAANVLLAGTSTPKAVDIDFSRPDMNPLTGMQSSDYTMEYQHSDLPTLAEGDQVQVDGYDCMFKVRQVPRVEGRQASGFFRTAFLTEVR